MATIQQQVSNANAVIEQNLEAYTGDRGFLSQNVLGQLRNLVEGLMVWAASGNPSEDFHYNDVAGANMTAKASAKFRLLSRFHGLLQSSASHYTLERDASERLMLKYYEYLLRTRTLVLDQLKINILANLELFPLNTDPAMREYHDKISSLVDGIQASKSPNPRLERYYIHSSRPFFVKGQIYYEVTFSLAHNRTSKFDRNIGFTNIDVTDKYAAQLELTSGTIDVFSQTMPITVIRSWAVSLRPCELDNFASLFGPIAGKVSTSQSEYRNLMRYLTITQASLLDLVQLDKAAYVKIRTWALEKTKGESIIFSVLDKARSLLSLGKPGSRLISYLLLRMRNETIKAQRDGGPNSWMSGLHVSSQSKPFDTMPFCTSPRRHMPRFSDVAEAISSGGREHELLSRRIMRNVEQHGVIYTPDDELLHFGDIDDLIAKYNGALPPTPRHAPRKLVHDKGHVFMAGYENDTVAIITELQALATSGVLNHSTDVLSYIATNPNAFDDPLKSAALTALFDVSGVALIYGAAGTGKSTMINHIANYFAAEDKLFLAHTNPAVDNLKRRVSADNSTFSTIKSQTNRSSGIHYDLVVIDECSTVSNASLLEVLEKTSFDLLVLVGDVYQIESIEFGNWFATIRSYLPPKSVFELTKPFRTSDEALLTFWDRVRKLDDKIEESISQSNFATVLGDSLFTMRRSDEIILCLNYDGLYGINNVNRFLQASNANPPVTWSEATYKAGDPVLFTETDRFGGVIFNNLKGTIVRIEKVNGRITFDVDIDRDLSPGDFTFSELRHVEDSTVQFDVFERGNTDEDDDTSSTIVPFQIAYAVSIHKAQGLEYDSVKVVITDENEANISHATFYTAITRARERLEIFWTPEAQQRMLSRLEVRENSKDEHLLRSRRGVTPQAKRPKLANDRPAV